MTEDIEISTQRLPQADELSALERLIVIAQGETEQARHVASFLLAWWGGGSCGTFDLTALWEVDAAVAQDIVKVFALVAIPHVYPDNLGFEAGIKAAIHVWKPGLE